MLKHYSSLIWNSNLTEHCLFIWQPRVCVHKLQVWQRHGSLDQQVDFDAPESPALEQGTLKVLVGEDTVGWPGVQSALSKSFSPSFLPVYARASALGKEEKREAVVLWRAGCLGGNKLGRTDSWPCLSLHLGLIQAQQPHKLEWLAAFENWLPLILLVVLFYHILIISIAACGPLQMPYGLGGASKNLDRAEPLLLTHSLWA